VSPAHSFSFPGPSFLRAEANPSIYPTIDPKAHYDAQIFAGKVVLITGASRGIGAEIALAALQYARNGSRPNSP